MSTPGHSFCGRVHDCPEEDLDITSPYFANHGSQVPQNVTSPRLEDNLNGSIQIQNVEIIPSHHVQSGSRPASAKRSTPATPAASVLDGTDTTPSRKKARRDEKPITVASLIPGSSSGSASPSTVHMMVESGGSKSQALVPTPGGIHSHRVKMFYHPSIFENGDGRNLFCQYNRESGTQKKLFSRYLQRLPPPHWPFDIILKLPDMALPFPMALLPPDYKPSLDTNGNVVLPDVGDWKWPESSGITRTGNLLIGIDDGPSTQQQSLNPGRKNGQSSQQELGQAKPTTEHGIIATAGDHLHRITAPDGISVNISLDSGRTQPKTSTVCEVASAQKWDRQTMKRSKTCDENHPYSSNGSGKLVVISSKVGLTPSITHRQIGPDAHAICDEILPNEVAGEISRPSSLWGSTAIASLPASAKTSSTDIDVSSVLANRMPKLPISESLEMATAGENAEGDTMPNSQQNASIHVVGNVKSATTPALRLSSSLEQESKGISGKQNNGSGPTEPIPVYRLPTPDVLAKVRAKLREKHRKLSMAPSASSELGVSAQKADKQNDARGLRRSPSLVKSQLRTKTEENSHRAYGEQTDK